MSRRLCRRCGKPGTFYKGYRICKKCKRQDTYKWRADNQEKHRRQNLASATRCHQRNRALILTAYGGKCACCSEKHEAFLALDHKKGQGNAHRRSLTKSGKMASTSMFYAWVIKNNFPDDFQLLCHNCNFAKSHYPGGCPHQKGAA